MGARLSTDDSQVTLVGAQTGPRAGTEGDFFIWGKQDDGKWTDTICGDAGVFDKHPGCPSNSLLWSDDGMQECRCADPGNKATKSGAWGRHKKLMCANIKYDWQEVCPYLGSSLDTQDEGGGQVGAVGGIPTNPGLDPAHKVTCQYKRGMIASSCAAATEYTKRKRAELGVSDRWFDTELMKDLCSQRGQADHCPQLTESKSYKDGNGVQICSNLLSCDLCRQWADLEESDASVNPLIDTWCHNNFDIINFNDPSKSDPACKCYNYSLDPRMKEVTKGSGVDILGSPHCWYAPCTNDPNLKTTLDQRINRHPPVKIDCQPICLFDIDLENAKNVYANDWVLNINCPSQCDGKTESGCSALAAGCQWCTNKCVKRGECGGQTSCSGRGIIDCATDSNCSWCGDKCVNREECGCSARDADSCEGDGTCTWCQDKCVDKNKCTGNWWKDLSDEEQMTIMVAGGVGIAGVGLLLLAVAK